jgi:Amino acid permease
MDSRRLQHAGRTFFVSETLPASSLPAQNLDRVLKLKDLILYGIVLIMPIAPILLFGVVQKLSHGHAVTTILIAMVAMMLTAFSYGRMTALYPSAGSAYTYVGRGLNLHLGFLAGWAMLLDYLLVPLICTVYGALTIQRLVPQVPFWAALFAVTITVINLRGIRATANANLAMMVVMIAVVLAFMALATHWLFSAGLGGAVLDPALLRSTYLHLEEHCDRHVRRRSYLRRVRWRQHALGRCRKSAAQHSDRHCIRLLFHRHLRRPADLPGATSLTRFSRAAEPGDRIHGCDEDRRRAFALRCDGHHPDRRESRRGAQCAGRHLTSSLLYGKRSGNRIYGAGRGGRTPTRLPSADFESAASASSAIPAFYRQIDCPSRVASNATLCRRILTGPKSVSHGGLPVARIEVAMSSWILQFAVGSTRYCSSFPSGSS